MQETYFRSKTHNLMCAYTTAMSCFISYEFLFFFLIFLCLFPVPFIMFSRAGSLGRLQRYCEIHQVS